MDREAQKIRPQHTTPSTSLPIPLDRFGRAGGSSGLAIVALPISSHPQFRSPGYGDYTPARMNAMLMLRLGLVVSSLVLQSIEGDNPPIPTGRGASSSSRRPRRQSSRPGAEGRFHAVKDLPASLCAGEGTVPGDRAQERQDATSPGVCSSGSIPHPGREFPPSGNRSWPGGSCSLLGQSTRGTTATCSTAVRLAIDAVHNMKKRFRIDPAPGFTSRASREAVGPPACSAWPMPTCSRVRSRWLA